MSEAKTDIRYEAQKAFATGPPSETLETIAQDTFEALAAALNHIDVIECQGSVPSEGASGLASLIIDNRTKAHMLQDRLMALRLRLGTL